MFGRAVCASDVATAVLLQQLVHSGREQNLEFSLNPVLPIQIMCFLQDTVQDVGCTVFRSSAEYIGRLGSYIGEDTDFVNKFDKKCLFESVDDLLGFGDSLGTILSSPPDISPNGVVAPTMISADSYLGVFLRALVVEMENMTFEGNCNLFNQILAYHGKACSYDETFLPDGMKSLPMDSFATIPKPTVGSLRKAQDAVLRSDFFLAEEMIHDFFDIYHPSNGNSSSNKSTAISYANDSPDSSRRYQQAMINMASAAVQTGNYRQALTSVEEGMKIAHQRGDHASVAQALLLLFYVVLRMDSGQLSHDQLGGKLFTVGPRSVLVRCLNQCVTIKAHNLTKQATILFVRQLCDSGFLSDSKKSSSYGLSDADRTDAKSVSELWLLLLMADYNKFSVLENQLKIFGVRSSVTSTEPGVTVDMHLMSDSNSLLQSAEIAHTASRMWLKLGCCGFSALECRRLLRKMVKSYHYASPVLIGDAMASICSTSALLCAVEGALRGSTIRNRCLASSRAENICTGAADMLRPYSSHSAMREIESTKLLIQMLSCSDIVAARNYCFDYIEINKLVDQSKGVISPAIVRGQILLALVFALFEAETAISMLRDIEERSVLGSVINGKELAMISRAVVLRFAGGCDGSQCVTVALLLLEAVLNSCSSGSESLRPGVVIEGIVTVIVEKFKQNEPLEQIYQYLLPIVCVSCI